MDCIFCYPSTTNTAASSGVRSPPKLQTLAHSSELHLTYGIVDELWVLVLLWAFAKLCDPGDVCLLLQITVSSSEGRKKTPSCTNLRLSSWSPVNQNGQNQSNRRETSKSLLIHTLHTYTWEYSATTNPKCWLELGFKYQQRKRFGASGQKRQVLGR